MDDAATRKLNMMRVFVRETGIRVSFVINSLSFSQHFEVCVSFLLICLKNIIFLNTEMNVPSVLGKNL